MSVIKIQNAGAHPIYTAGLVNAAKSLLTGLSNVYIRVRRFSDGYWLDFGDMTFKASAGTVQTAMAEVDATNLPGVYRYNFDLSSVTNETANDVYVFRATCASAVNAPQEGAIVTDDLEAKSGWGDRTFTATVQDSDTNPINGATVQVRDSGGSIIVAKNTTGATGTATFLLDDGSYKVYVYARGYAFSNPYSLTVSGDGATTYTGTGDGSSEVTPPDAPDVCRVYGYVYDVNGNPVQGVRVTAELSSRSAYVTDAASGTMLVTTRDHTVSDADGFWYLDLVPNSLLEVEPESAIGEPSGETDTTYRFTFVGEGFKKEYPRVTVPDEDTQDFKGLV